MAELSKAALQKIKIGDFEILDTLEFQQQHLEDWAIISDAIVEEQGVKSVGDLPMVVYRRVTAQAALKAGWFKRFPKGLEPEHIRSLHPSVIHALSLAVQEAYNDITKPSENFTEPQ